MSKNECQHLWVTVTSNNRRVQVCVRCGKLRSTACDPGYDCYYRHDDGYFYDEEEKTNDE
jgi:hypothetical protein